MVKARKTKESTNSYLLIVACSQRKRLTPDLLPAIERYDGITYRVLRKAKREGHWPKNLDVLILSAKYGFVEPEAKIENYDLKMTKRRAIELKPKAKLVLVKKVRTVCYTEIFVNLGKIYLSALDDWEAELKPETSVIYATGGIGQKTAQMCSWLMKLARMGR